jgi:hypothetical protein
MKVGKMVVAQEGGWRKIAITLVYEVLASAIILPSLYFTGSSSFPRLREDGQQSGPVT